MPKAAVLTRPHEAAPDSGSRMSAPAMVREGLRRAILSGE